METSWTTTEDSERIVIVHDNRWLAIIGVPLGVLGLVVAAGPWFIEDARRSGAWPILAAGSLIGVGLVVFGLALCCKYEEIAADRRARVVVWHIGLNPFRRTRIRPLADFTEVLCLDEKMIRGSGRAPSIHHRVRLRGPQASVLLASCLETEPVRVEGRRWATFLDLPLRDTLGTDLETHLRDTLAKTSKSVSS